MLTSREFLGWLDDRPSGVVGLDGDSYGHFGLVWVTILAWLAWSYMYVSVGQIDGMMDGMMNNGAQSRHRTPLFSHVKLWRV
jgi:hypothetical protein